MDAINAVRGGFDDMTRWQQIAFCASCAERVTPIIMRLAQADLIGLWGNWLNALWAATIAETSDHAIQLLETIEGRPEAHFTDSHYSEYYVMRAIGMLWYTLTAMEAANPAEHARYVSEGMCSFAADFDFAISEDRRREILNEPLHVRDVEVGIQERTLIAIRQTSTPSITLRDWLREDAKSAAQIFDKLLPDYCRAHSWRFV